MKIALMKVKHIVSQDIWLMSKGNKILYRGKSNPWHSPRIVATALLRVGIKVT